MKARRGWRCARGWEGKKDLLFLKKKKQKGFYPLGVVASARHNRHGPKILWLLFSKSNVLLFFDNQHGRG